MSSKCEEQTWTVNVSSFEWALTEHIYLPILDLSSMTVSNGAAVNLKVMLVVNLTGTKLECDTGSKLDGY